MWAIILHGGAKTIEPADEFANRQGCLAALKYGADVLKSGGPSIDAVEAAVLALENDPTFNAGYGSALNSDGELETCAAIMEGGEWNVGAVATLKGIRNPVRAARAMLFEEPTLIAAEGARKFAAKMGVELCSEKAMAATGKEEESKQKRHDTVGCVALDDTGQLAAAVSTGGLEGSPEGRIGDSPQPGCGFYCDNDVGGVVFSGDGEHIARTMLAARVIYGLDGTTPDAAIEAAIRVLQKVGGKAGAIALTPDGRFGWEHNSSHFAVAYEHSSMPHPRVHLCKKGKDKQHG
jgi:L-asparaginase / beta-aspartyl-peptidase